MSVIDRLRPKKTAAKKAEPMKKAASAPAKKITPKKTASKKIIPPKIVRHRGKPSTDQEVQAAVKKVVTGHGWRVADITYPSIKGARVQRIQFSRVL